MAKAKKTSTSQTKSNRSTKKPVKKKAPSTKRKTSSANAKKATPTKKAAAKKPAKGKAATEEVTEGTATISRRKADRRNVVSDQAEAAPKIERREKVNRRRQIDPTTCERDYSEDEVEFMNALELYKRKSGRMFPTCSEVLEVVRGLGYVRRSEIESPAPLSSGLEAVSGGSEEVSLESEGESAESPVLETPFTPVSESEFGFEPTWASE